MPSFHLAGAVCELGANVRRQRAMRGTPKSRKGALTAPLGVASLLVLAPIALMSAPVAGAASPCGANGAFTQIGSIVTCHYTAAGQDTFSVPSGVSSLDVIAAGARGGDGTGYGGAGAMVRDASVPVLGGENLTVWVGSPGASSGFGSGGAGGAPGGGPGGAQVTAVGADTPP